MNVNAPPVPAQGPAALGQHKELEMQNFATLRLIESHELNNVSGGTDEIVVIGTPSPNSISTEDWLQFRAAFDASQFGSLSGLMGGGGSGPGGPGGAPGEFVDTDNDGEEDTIVVTAQPWQSEVMDAWRTWVNVHIAAGELLMLLVPLSRITEMTIDALMALNRDSLVEMLTTTYYDMDRADQLIDGYVQPVLLPSHPPQLQPGYWL